MRFTATSQSVSLMEKGKQKGGPGEWGTGRVTQCVCGDRWTGRGRLQSGHLGKASPLQSGQTEGQGDKERERQMDWGEGQADMGDRETGKVGVIGTGP